MLTRIPVSALAREGELTYLPPGAAHLGTPWAEVPPAASMAGAVGGPGEGAGEAVGGPGEGAGEAIGGPDEGPGEAIGGPDEGPGEAIGGPDEGPGEAIGGPDEGPGEAIGGPDEGPGEDPGEGPGDEHLSAGQIRFRDFTLGAFNGTVRPTQSRLIKLGDNTFETFTSFSDGITIKVHIPSPERSQTTRVNAVIPGYEQQMVWSTRGGATGKPVHIDNISDRNGTWGRITDGLIDYEHELKKVLKKARDVAGHMTHDWTNLGEAT
ncbi:hypothetical protein [Sorangium sp. So ce861]|uniref:hypothetical protein n=1 Tax=Sorangium sp. So ce861 TaxID=3133323 RepID=UPI003F635E9A